MAIFIAFLEVALSYEYLSRPSVGLPCRLAGWSAGLGCCHNFKEREANFQTPCYFKNPIQAQGNGHAYQKGIGKRRLCLEIKE